MKKSRLKRTNGKKLLIKTRSFQTKSILQPGRLGLCCMPRKASEVSKDIFLSNRAKLSGNTQKAQGKCKGDSVDSQDENSGELCQPLYSTQVLRRNIHGQEIAGPGEGKRRRPRVQKTSCYDNSLAYVKGSHKVYSNEP